MEEQIAALDLGSNSFHLVVARVTDGRLTIVDRIKEPVRLGGGLDERGYLDDLVQERALACVERFGQRLRGLPEGMVRAVGTNTLRKAKNGRAFAERAQEALRHPVEIIAGREEARLVYLGVAQTMGADARRRLVVDIGGGSTECIIGEGFDILDADSLFMGCVSFTQKYFPMGILRADRFDDAEIAAQLELQSIVGPYCERGWERAIGCSGTILSIGDVHRANGWSDGEITKKGLKRLKKALVAAGHIQSISVPGLAEDRKPVIPGGLAILRAIFDAFHLESLSLSPGALREGLLYDLIGRLGHEDVRDRTITGCCERYGVDRAHAGQVEATAHRLLAQVAEAWAIEEARGRQILSWAASLHEIGAALSHTGYHKHSAYIIQHSDMAGFSRDAQAVLAAIVVNHRRKIVPAAFEAVAASRRELTVKLCLLFRLAVTLNRSRDPSQVPPYVLRAKKARLSLAFPDGWLAQHPLTARDLAQEAAYFAASGHELETREAA